MQGARPQRFHLAQIGERSNTLHMRSGSIFVSRFVSKNLVQPHRENACGLFIWP